PGRTQTPRPPCSFKRGRRELSALNSLRPLLSATRKEAYRRMVMDAVDPADVETIRRHLQRQHAYGSNRFREAIEAQLGRSVGPQKIGRPRKEKERGNQISATGSDSLS